MGRRKKVNTDTIDKIDKGPSLGEDLDLEKTIDKDVDVDVDVDIDEETVTEEIVTKKVDVKKNDEDGLCESGSTDVVFITDATIDTEGKRHNFYKGLKTTVPNSILLKMTGLWVKAR